MTGPRELAERMERAAALPSGDSERFAGYGVLGLPFASGHVLALRRWPATSLGSAQTSVWHRSPYGPWTFYSDVPPALSCPRYFGAAVSRAVVAPIELSWTADYELSVKVGGEVQLDWRLTLVGTRTTATLNALGGIIPDRLWHQQWLLAVLGRTAGWALGAGRIRLSGHTPNHQWFIANPRRIWAVVTSPASLGGRDLGPIAPLSRQANLADFWIPQRGLFAIGRAFLEPLDAGRHVVTSLPAGLETAVPF